MSFFLNNLRLLWLAFFSIVITCLLFSFMYYMTGSGDRHVMLTPDVTPTFDFIRIRPDKEEIEQQRRIPELQEPRNKPQIPPPPTQQFRLHSETGRISADVPYGLDIRSGFGTALFNNREVTPLVRVEPIYPLRAQHRSIEGWVEVEFTIAEDGSVLNPIVVASEPSSIFNRTTLKAVAKWRYQPQIIDNQAVKRYGVRVIIEYRLEQ